MSVRITGIQVVLSSSSGKWVEDDIECKRKDIETHRALIKEDIESYGLKVEMVRFKLVEPKQNK